MKKMKLEQKILNSKLAINKNFLYFMIAPLVIILVGIILLSTVGLNLGTDFTGYSTLKVYVNNEPEITDTTVGNYDLNDTDDYNTVHDKIFNALSDTEVRVTSYVVSSMNIISNDFVVANGQAIELKYQHNTTNLEEIEIVDLTVRESIIQEFAYDNFEDAVSSADYVAPQANFGWAIAIVASIVFALIVAAIYLTFRYNPSASLVMLMQVALDIFLTIALLAICRITINYSMGIILLATFVFTLFNLIYFYMSAKENITSEKHGQLNIAQLSDITAKEILFKKTLIYLLVLVGVILFIAVAVAGVRSVALGLLVSLVVTFYTSTFILPTLWTTLYKAKAKKTHKTK